MNNDDKLQETIARWRRILKPNRDWVLFEHGTCVVCSDRKRDPKEYALETLEKHGPVYPGTPLGDFSPGSYEDPPGVLVTYSHPDILSFIPRKELDDPESEFHLGVGLVARENRKKDAASLIIVHVEIAK